MNKTIPAAALAAFLSPTLAFGQSPKAVSPLAPLPEECVPRITEVSEVRSLADVVRVDETRTLQELTRVLSVYDPPRTVVVTPEMERAISRRKIDDEFRFWRKMARIAAVVDIVGTVLAITSGKGKETGFPAIFGGSALSVAAVSGTMSFVGDRYATHLHHKYPDDPKPARILRNTAIVRFALGAVAFFIATK